jgi:hypothetical protein
MALTDFSTGIPDGAVAMLEEMYQHDECMGDLFLAVMLEKRPVGDKRLEEAMSPDVLEKLKTIRTFKEWWDQSGAEGRAEGRVEGQAEGAVGHARNALVRYFRVRHQKVSQHAKTMIDECSDAAVLDGWLDRAYAGETPEQIFGDR